MALFIFSIGDSIFNLLNCLINQYPYEIFVEYMQYGINLLIGVLHWLIGAFRIFGAIPLYAHKLLSKPNGTSVWKIITNPQVAFNQPKRVKRHIYRHYNMKGCKYFHQLPSKLFVHSCYQSIGTYTHHDTEVNLDGIYSIASYFSTAVQLANQTFKVPYTFLSKRFKKPYRNGYWTNLIVLLLCIIIHDSLGIQCSFNIIKQRHKTGIMSIVNRTVLTTT